VAKRLADCDDGERGIGVSFGPVMVLAVLYLLTALLTEFKSNSATAALR